MNSPRTSESARSSVAEFVLDGRFAVRRAQRLTAPGVSPRRLACAFPSAGRA